MEMMADPSNLMSKLAWKSSPLTVPGKCSVSHWLYYSIVYLIQTTSIIPSYHTEHHCCLGIGLNSVFLCVVWSRLRLEKSVRYVYGISMCSMQRYISTRLYIWPSFRRKITKVYISEYRTYAWMSLVSLQPGVHNILTNTKFMIFIFRTIIKNGTIS